VFNRELKDNKQRKVSIIYRIKKLKKSNMYLLITHWPDQNPILFPCGHRRSNHVAPLSLPRHTLKLSLLLSTLLLLLLLNALLLLLLLNMLLLLLLNTLLLLLLNTLLLLLLVIMRTP
jgi:hypothetical protein